MGVWSSGYDSRFGCGRSRVQIPARPSYFIIIKMKLTLLLLILSAFANSKSNLRQSTSTDTTEEPGCPIGIYNGNYSKSFYNMTYGLI